MYEVTLTRFAATDMGMFGKLRVENFACFTVERPWLGNTPFVSCIPLGKYSIVLGIFHKGNKGRGYPSYELLNVPNRSLIKIHGANIMDELFGCIAPGKELGWMKDKWAVRSSQKALREFMEAMNGVEESTITIKRSERFG